MKRVLLPLIAAFACVAPAMADDAVYGTTPETAKPFPTGGWLVENLADAPAEAWFTYKNTLTSPALWGDAASDYTNPTPLGQQVFVYLCNGGQQAFQMAAGSDSYVLLPDTEYLVKITPKTKGSFCYNAAMALPPKMEGQKPFYPIVIPTDQMNLTRTLAPGATVWYEITVPYPTQLTTNNMMMPVMDIEKIEAIHIECPGGTNTGSAIAGPYVKAGKNVVGITASSAATADVQFQLGYNAMVTLNCSNNLLRGRSLELDQNTTYPDAYYTVDRYFEVPEDGTYTFTNHGAPGTILNVGMVKLTDPDNNPYKSECDWTNIQTATVGTGDAVITVHDLKKGDIVAVQSDAFGVIGEGMANQPYLKVVKGGGSGIADVEAADALEVSINGGVLNVKSVLLAAGAEVAVYDMSAAKVASVKAPKGAETVAADVNLPAGVYMVVVYGPGNSESAKVVVK